MGDGLDIQGHSVLTTAQMYRADQAAEQCGIPSLSLMEAAGFQVDRAIRQRWPRCRTVVLCGPGNNGGDGFVIARLLRKAGWPVRLGLLGDASTLLGDAAVNAERWQAIGGKIEGLTEDLSDWGRLVVDALFGAGLSRPLDGAAATVIKALRQSQTPCIAVDIPSGVSGDTGAVVGGMEAAALSCALTVTFFRPKPGHIMLPGRDLCGELVVADIGIPGHVLGDLKPDIVVNGPGPWRLPEPLGSEDHKYKRGLALVYGSVKMSGAASLASASARRVGAGLVKVCAPKEARPLYLEEAPGLMFEAITDSRFLADQRASSVLIGPGFGVGEGTMASVVGLLSGGRSIVLDADALTSFSEEAETLFSAIKSSGQDVVLTPHEGEFARLFGKNEEVDKLTRARTAAKKSGAVVVFKGSDTVIAAPDDRAAMSVNAPPWLATAGSGDVLAGLICGLLAQGLTAWEAGCAGVWLHGEAAQQLGPGLIAEDLVDAIPEVLENAW